MGFLPRDVLYNDVTFDDSKKNILSALDILENAQDSKPKKEDEDNRSGFEKFWNSFNPFKCGSENK